VYGPTAPLDLAQLWGIVGRDRPDLKEEPWVPVTPSRLGDGDQSADLFAVIAERDLLVQHPYDSFATSVESLVTQAAADPDVLAIKQTLYRTSGDAQFVGALAQAAEVGKQVVALVELTARFDEQRNIAWARQLERAGVHVVYGVDGLKTHAKTTLVVRREQGGIRRYCHIGTGNYNSDTARIYEDIGLFTADDAIGSDLTDLFNHLTGFSRASRTRSLVLAPQGFRPWVLEQIEQEGAAGSGGRIAIKVNGLTDPEVIDALYRASQAGCPVDLIVRGLCCIRPGVPGLSETITVRSIVGRFLEHSRIYRFGTPSPAVLDAAAFGREEPPREAAHEARYFIGSADLIQRNLDYRIEALAPVHDVDLCGRLEDILRLCQLDDTFAWSLLPDGAWVRAEGRQLAAQHELQQLALERVRTRWSHETVA
jgi:polyphosphate kinase